MTVRSKEPSRLSSDAEAKPGSPPRPLSLAPRVPDTFESVRAGVGPVLRGATTHATGCSLTLRSAGPVGGEAGEQRAR